MYICRIPPGGRSTHYVFIEISLKFIRTVFLFQYKTMWIFLTLVLQVLVLYYLSCSFVEARELIVLDWIALGSPFFLSMIQSHIKAVCGCCHFANN